MWRLSTDSFFLLCSELGYVVYVSTNNLSVSVSQVAPIYLILRASMTLGNSCLNYPRLSACKFTLFLK